MHKNEKWTMLADTVLCKIFTVFTIIKLLKGSEPDRLALAVATLIFAARPMLINSEKVEML